MKRTMKPLAKEDIKSFMDQFTNLKAINTLLMDRIGFEGEDLTQTTQNPATKKKLLTLSLSEEMLKHVNKAPFRTKEGVFIRIGDKIYAHNTGIKGLSVHKDNPNIYLSPAPENIDNRWQLLPSYNHSDPLNASQIDVSVNEPKMIFGVEQAQEILEGIANRHPGKKITILVIGNTDTKENFEVYQKDVVEDKDSADPITQRYQLKKRFTSDPDADITIYYTYAVDRSVFLTSYTIDTLYAIYQDTIGTDSPLLIQSAQGENRAPKFALAFEILRNFDKLFHSTNNYIIRNELSKLYLQLQESSCASALSNPLDLEQAIYLAFALKMVELENQLKQQCVDFLKKWVKDKGFVSRAQKIEQILDHMKDMATCQSKSAYIQEMLVLESELTTHHIIPKAPELFRSRPAHTTLLENLATFYQKRQEVENQLFTLCETTEINNKFIKQWEEEAALESANASVTNDKISAQNNSIPTPPPLVEKSEEEKEVEEEQTVSSITP